MRNCLARIIPVLWLSLSFGLSLNIVKAATLAELVSAYREAPSAVKRAALEKYAASQPGRGAALARLALGVVSWEQKDYSDAITFLKSVPAELPLLSDYAGYYLASAHVEARDTGGVAQDLLTVRNLERRSPFAGRSWLVEARSLAPNVAVQLLLDHYAELPQPDGDLTLAETYQNAGDLVNASKVYQRVYSQYVAGDAFHRSSDALAALKETMGAAYPSPGPQLLLRHADRMAETRDYLHARAEYSALALKLLGPEREQAQVRIGVMHYLSNKTAVARALLKDLNLTKGPADAERLLCQTAHDRCLVGRAGLHRSNGRLVRFVRHAGDRDHGL